MTQHNFNEPDENGASYLAGINAALQALASVSRGATAPTTTYIGMYWEDTTASLLKRRNAADSGWIVVASLDETFVVSRASNTILGISDYGKTFIATSSFTQTLTAAATLGDGWHCDYRIESGVTIVFDPASSENIDGVATKTVVGPAGGKIACDGSGFKTVSFDRPGITLATEVASTSGTSIDFTGIPSGTRRIHVSFVGVSTNGTSPYLIQIGDSGGVETSGYLGSALALIVDQNLGNTFTTGCCVQASPVAGSINHGTAEITLENASTNTWTFSSVLGSSQGAAINIGGSSKSLSAVLDRVRITTVGGTDTFDAGAINISYQ